jgi:MFS family permease
MKPGEPEGTDSPLLPLSVPLFRMLWGTALAANVSLWMSDMASAWLMTSISSEPIWVALVQTAASVPVFLLGLPSGALADILDRRRYLLATQIWLAMTAVLLCTATVLDIMTAPLLLVLTLLNGVGLVMRWPVYAALMPASVPRAQVAQAMALSAVAMNASRIMGPLIAGLLISSAGIAWVFAVNAITAVLITLTVMRWKPQPINRPLERERLFGAMRVGLQFVGRSASLRRLLICAVVYFFHASAVLALLPLLARRMGGDAGTYSLMLASMGAGAIAVALLMPRLRQNFSKIQVIGVGIVLQSGTALMLALVTDAAWAAPIMFALGFSWLSTANSLGVSVQAALPDWVRARGMAMYQMAIMGGGALGAALWGQVATVGSLATTLLIASATGLLTLLLVHRFREALNAEEDLTPTGIFHPPVVHETPRGRVIVTIEYVIDPNQKDAFLVLMEESRRSRLRQGALEWSLLIEVDKPGLIMEQVTDASWTEHLRRFERLTAGDAALKEKKRAFHLLEEPPAIRRYTLA